MCGKYKPVHSSQVIAAWADLELPIMNHRNQKVREAKKGRTTEGSAAKDCSRTCGFWATSRMSSLSARRAESGARKGGASG